MVTDAKPLTCPRCKSPLGSWNPANGALVTLYDDPVPPSIEVTKARIRCRACGRTEYFDGIQLINRERRRET